MESLENITYQHCTWAAVYRVFMSRLLRLYMMEKLGGGGYFTFLVIINNTY